MAWTCIENGIFLSRRRACVQKRPFFSPIWGVNFFQRHHTTDKSGYRVEWQACFKDGFRVERSLGTPIHRQEVGHSGSYHLYRNVRLEYLSRDWVGLGHKDLS